MKTWGNIEKANKKIL